MSSVRARFQAAPTHLAVLACPLLMGCTTVAALETGSSPDPGAGGGGEAQDVRHGLGPDPTPNGGSDTPLPPDPLDKFPRTWNGSVLLSGVGMYADIRQKVLAEGVIPYDVRYPLWSDGLEKSRFVQLPAGSTVDTSDMNFWRFPVGTKVWKEFRVAKPAAAPGEAPGTGKRLETRMLIKESESEFTGWQGVSFVWNEEETEAFAYDGGAKGVLGTEHNVPSTKECFSCHSGPPDRVIGLGPIQLTLAEAQRGTDNDLLTRWINESRFSATPSDEAPAAQLPISQGYEAPGEGVVKEALGYLHGNCGHCHSDVAPLAPARPLRLFLPVGLSDPLQAPVYQTAVGKLAWHTHVGPPTLVSPGNPDESHLYFRMLQTDYNSMPPLGKRVVDPAGLAVIHAWISGIASTP